TNRNPSRSDTATYCTQHTATPARCALRTSRPAPPPCRQIAPKTWASTSPKRVPTPPVQRARPRPPLSAPPVAATATGPIFQAQRHREPDQLQVSLAESCL